MSSCPIDEASETAELFLKAAMTSRSYRKILPKGECHYCECQVLEGALFCPGEDCSHDWHEEQRKLQIAGK